MLTALRFLLLFGVINCVVAHAQLESHVSLQPPKADAEQTVSVTVTFRQSIHLERPFALYRVYGTDGTVPIVSDFPSFILPNLSDTLIFESAHEPVGVLPHGKQVTYRFHSTFKIPDRNAFRPALFVLADIWDFRKDGSFVLVSGTARFVLRCEAKDSSNPKSGLVSCVYKTPALIAEESH
jgi:hypothetical protein